MKNSNQEKVKKENLFRINSVVVFQKNNKIFLKFNSQVNLKELFLILKYYVQRFEKEVLSFTFEMFDLRAEPSHYSLNVTHINLKSFDTFYISISSMLDLRFFESNQISQKDCLCIQVNLSSFTVFDFNESKDIKDLFLKLQGELGYNDSNLLIYGV